MRRKTFDKLVASAGLLIAGLLVAAGGLLLWGNSFVSDQVNDQLSAQQIYFPEAGSEGLQDPAVKPYLEKYAGQQVTTGAQAKAFADHYIAVHLDKMTGGQTYAELSHKAMANPDDQKLAGQVATVFKGETLRGMLLNAYAFDTMGTVAGYASYAAFGGAAALGALSLAGFAHGKRTDETVVLGAAKQPALATA
jgi:hypothetical protein